MIDFTLHEIGNDRSEQLLIRYVLSEIAYRAQIFICRSTFFFAIGKNNSSGLQGF